MVPACQRGAQALPYNASQLSLFFPQEVSEGLQQLKHRNRQVHALLAEEESRSEAPPSQPQRRGGSGGRYTPRHQPEKERLPLEEQCRLQQLEERQLREEIAALNSKVGADAWPGLAWPFALIVCTVRWRSGCKILHCCAGNAVQRAWPYCSFARDGGPCFAPAARPACSPAATRCSARNPTRRCCEPTRP